MAGPRPRSCRRRCPCPSPAPPCLRRSCDRRRRDHCCLLLADASGRCFCPRESLCDGVCCCSCSCSGRVCLCCCCRRRCRRRRRRRCRRDDLCCCCLLCSYGRERRCCFRILPHRSCACGAGSRRLACRRRPAAAAAAAAAAARRYFCDAPSSSSSAPSLAHAPQVDVAPGSSSPGCGPFPGCVLCQGWREISKKRGVRGEKGEFPPSAARRERGGAVMPRESQDRWIAAATAGRGRRGGSLGTRDSQGCVETRLTSLQDQERITQLQPAPNVLRADLIYPTTMLVVVVVIFSAGGVLSCSCWTLPLCSSKHVRVCSPSLSAPTLSLFCVGKGYCRPLRANSRRPQEIVPTIHPPFRAQTRGGTGQ